ncbi:MAG TPA: phosphate ABC transporter permease subunit PstC [Nitrososphaerales archaeon]|nr:phosphate ABC transporter permease subunit PstC [Nitrososphaerales archaeon]
MAVGSLKRRGRSIVDAGFRDLSFAFAAFIVFLILLYIIEIGYHSLPSIRAYGLSYVIGSEWNPPREIFEVLPEILGTLASSIIALVIGVPISLGVAVFLAEISPRGPRVVIGPVVELLAAVPSIVFGFWALLVLVPQVIRPVEHALSASLGFIPLFHGAASGYDLFSAGVILAIMIIPYVAAVSRDAMQAVPRSQLEAAYALGGTKSEVIQMSVFGYARSGIIAGIFLGFGRAIGETMAVTLVIGNSLEFKASLFAPAQTLASLIANDYSETIGVVQVSAIIEAGLVLLALSLLSNLGARLILRRFVKRGAQLL